MTDISQGIDAYFWLTLVTIFCGGMNLFIRYAYRSKCRRCKICCIKIERDIEIEEREDLAVNGMMLHTSQSIDPLSTV